MKRNLQPPKLGLLEIGLLEIGLLEFQTLSQTRAQAMVQSPAVISTGIPL
jgi:hypothetical protein